MTASSASRTTRPRSPPFPSRRRASPSPPERGKAPRLICCHFQKERQAPARQLRCRRAKRPASRLPDSAGTLRASVSGSMAVCSASGRFQAKQVLPRYQPPPAAGARRDACSPGSGGNISFPPCGRTLPSSGESETVIPLSPAAASRSAWRGASPLRDDIAGIIRSQHPAPFRQFQARAEVRAGKDIQRHGGRAVSA